MTQYLTTADRVHLFASVPDRIEELNPALSSRITIDRNAQRQEIAGFGFTVTGGSASHINGMPQAARTALLQELFGTGEGSIGLSFIRISVGASDLDATAFSYNENPDDLTHTGFSLGPHSDHLVPVLQEILSVNPDVAIMAAPWSAPHWMKTNDSFVGGSLAAQHQSTYASYLVKYLETMEREGIEIDYLSVQNEPLHGGNNPSMLMSAQEMAGLVKDHLGPALADAGLATKLLVYDHNADNIDYPLTVLGDAAAAAYVDGSAFHLYGGSIDALSTVHDTHPNKHIYFTEQWYGATGDFMGDFQWHMRNVLVGSLRNWSRAVIEWNLSSNPTLTPHTAGGCDQCLGAITIDGESVVRNQGYYVIAHAAKFVRPGSFYVSSESTMPLRSAACLTPRNEIVLIVMNDSGESQSFNVEDGATQFSTALEPGSTATFVWGGT